MPVILAVLFNVKVIRRSSYLFSVVSFSFVRMMEEPKENSSQSESKTETDDEIVAEKTKYFNALRKWLYQMQMSQITACLPYYFFPSQFPMQFPQSPDRRSQQSTRNTNATRQPNVTDFDRNGGVEYVIPPLWKRIVAEFLDFFFLFITKVIFTFIAVDYLDLINLEKYNVLNTKMTTLHLLKQITEDYDFAFEITSEIFILEIINRLGACVFETVFLSDVLGGVPWGATPGKALMGLRVVYATNIIPVDNRQRETVIVYPGTNLSFGVALLRSAVKNALITIVFPVCMFTLFFQFNRTTYDVISNVVVVEDRVQNQRRQ